MADSEGKPQNGGTTTTPQDVQLTTTRENGYPPIAAADSQPSGEAQGTKVYKKRWFMLALFVCYSGLNSFNWTEYVIIPKVVTTYYGVGDLAVESTSMVYMLTYIPLIFPGSWFLEKKGLRLAVLIGSFGTMAGTWIKCGSISPDRYVVTFLGQTVIAISQVFILGIPPRLAAVWFGHDQVSTACAIGVFGNQMGIAIGFLIPPMVVPYSENLDEMGYHLGYLFYGTATLTTILFVLIAIFFRDAPPLPPSKAQLAIQDVPPGGYKKSILTLVKHKNYMLLLVTYGMNVGVFYAVSTLLGQVVIAFYPNAAEDAGRIGLVIVLSGMLGSVICGVILDKTKRFKETTIVVYALSFLGMLIYALTINLGHIWLVYLMAALLGFFMTGYLPVGFEFAAEITYPEPEGTSSGLLNASAQVFGLLFTLTASKIKDVSILGSNLFLASTMLLGTILTALVKADLKRYQAQTETTNNTTTTTTPTSEQATQFMPAV